jgi:hypothetical protein
MARQPSRERLLNRQHGWNGHSNGASDISWFRWSYRVSELEGGIVLP